MELAFQDGPTYHNDDDVMLSDMHHSLIVTMHHRGVFAKTDRFTLVVRDLDRKYLHLLVVNTPFLAKSDGTLIHPYALPAYKDHRYTFEIYVQARPFDPTFDYGDRNIDNFDGWVVEEGLELVRRITLTASKRDPQQKYCSCVLKVEANNRHRGTTYNPYAVCRKSTKGYSENCNNYYSLTTLPIDQLEAYASLEGVSPLPTTREELIAAIHHKQQK